MANFVGYFACVAAYVGGKTLITFLLTFFPFRLIPLLLREIGINPNSLILLLLVGFLLFFLSGFLSSLISRQSRTAIIPIQVILLIFTYAMIESYRVSNSYIINNFSNGWMDTISPTYRIADESVILLFIGVPAFHLGRKFSSRFVPMNLENENLLRIT